MSVGEIRNYENYVVNMNKFVEEKIKTYFETLPKIQVAKIASVKGLVLTLINLYDGSNFSGYLVQNTTLGATLNLKAEVGGLVLAIPTFYASLNSVEVPTVKLDKTTNSADFYCFPLQTSFDIPQASNTFTLTDITEQPCKFQITQMIAGTDPVTATPDLTLIKGLMSI